MKRSAALTELSREHHTALVLAKQAQRLARAHVDAEEVIAFMQTLNLRFENELEPHFQIEETTLLPMLEQSAGNTDNTEASALVLRTKHEHEALRELAQRIALRDSSSLEPFGELLAAHVRFEERELFNLAETLLSPQQLAHIANACAH